jgi:energy-coupling factor transport system permease protein
VEPHVQRPWHAVTWLVWAFAASLTIQLAPSPVYVALVIGIAWLMVAQHAIDGPAARVFPVLIIAALVFAALRVVLTAITTHGSESVWFTTPSFRVPEMLGGFDVGGPVSGPVVLQAAAESFVVIGIIAVFAAFNAVVSHYELVQTIPRAFYELGLIVVVALAVVPTTIEAVHEVREADRARTGGKPVRRGRLLRQIVPVLEHGLERAITLSESLDSRGFARTGATARQRGAGWVGAGALLLLGSAFVALVARESTIALVLGFVGGIGLAIAVSLASRATGRARYRPRRITRADWLCMAGALIAPLALGALTVADEPSLTWTPSPLRWPAVSILGVLALAPLLAPLMRVPSAARADELPSKAHADRVGTSLPAEIGAP